jgi:hypothetical protein
MDCVLHMDTDNEEASSSNERSSIECGSGSVTFTCNQSTGCLLSNHVEQDSSHSLRLLSRAWGKGIKEKKWRSGHVWSQDRSGTRGPFNSAEILI